MAKIPVIDFASDETYLPVDMFLDKPIELEAFVETINELLGERREEPKHPLWDLRAVAGDMVDNHVETTEQVPTSTMLNWTNVLMAVTEHNHRIWVRTELSAGFLPHKGQEAAATYGVESITIRHIWRI
jgi:hypothetical protein